MSETTWPFPNRIEPTLDSTFPIGQVVFDLDGVLADGVWPVRGSIGSPIPDGIKLLKYYADKGFSVCIHTSRGSQDLDLIWAWIKEHNLPVDKVKTDKPVAAIYFDDRAWRFPL